MNANLEIPRDLVERFRLHGAKTYPEECCGLLLGKPGDEVGTTVVVKLIEATNEREEEARHNRFVIDPKAILLAQKEANREGLSIVGYYHSHPDHPAQPSEFDREHAWPDTSYVIVSVREGVPGDQRSWRLTDDREQFLEERIMTL